MRILAAEACLADGPQRGVDHHGLGCHATRLGQEHCSPLVRQVAVEVGGHDPVEGRSGEGGREGALAEDPPFARREGASPAGLGRRHPRPTAGWCAAAGAQRVLVPGATMPGPIVQGERRLLSRLESVGPGTARVGCLLAS